jgi:chromosome segregation ATPase
LEEEQEKMKAEQDRMAQIRAAYNSDKRALQERIAELEAQNAQSSLNH